MKPHALFLLLLLVFGCDGRDFAGPEEHESRLISRTFQVAYRVEGTYGACSITYVNADRKPATAEAAPLPWETGFQLRLKRSGPVYLSVRATCADSTKLGKSTAFLLLDGAVKARGSAVGFGATSEAGYLIGP